MTNHGDSNGKLGLCRVSLEFGVCGLCSQNRGLYTFTCSAVLFNFLVKKMHLGLWGLETSRLDS